MYSDMSTTLTVGLRVAATWLAHVQSSHQIFMLGYILCSGRYVVNVASTVKPL